MRGQAAKLYALLLANANRTVSFSKIRCHINTGAKRPDILVWWLICRIRDELPAGQEIKAVYGVGYRLILRQSLVASEVAKRVASACSPPLLARSQPQ